MGHTIWKNGKYVMVPERKFSNGKLYQKKYVRVAKNKRTGAKSYDRASYKLGKGNSDSWKVRW